MFIKRIDKKDRNGKRKYIYYRLCESYRIGDQSRQRTVLSLGKLDELTSAEQHKQLSDRIEALISGQAELFYEAGSNTVELLAQKFYAQLCENKKVEQKSIQPYENDFSDDETLVKLSTLSHEQAHEIGAEWLCLQAIQQLDIHRFFVNQGWNEKQVNTALTHIISKAVYPASEHKTAQWIKDNSAVKELLFGSPVSISRHQLYKSGIKLYQCKETLETHLSHKTNELFDIEDTIILYDLTNTYFEGRKTKSEKAKFGPSKEKRSDARLLALALICNQQGFVKYSKIYSGNISDPSTLCETIDELTIKTSVQSRKPMVVIDAGISTKENLLKIKERGYDYLCVTRSKLKDYIVSQSSKGLIEVFDKRGQKIEIQHVEKEGESDKFLYVRSHAKAKKEAQMGAYFSQHYEEELQNMESSLHKKGGTKKIEKVYERLGRIKERYPSANKHYHVEINSDGKFATAIKWTRLETTPKPTDGVYFLRTSNTSLSEKDIWNIYNTLTQIEATFRILKTDLHLRPVFHILDEHADAHIHLGIVAYMVVSAIRYQLKKNNIHHDWQNIVRIMNTQKMIVSTVKDDGDQFLMIKKCTKPIPEVLEIYQAMNYKQTPFRMKKYVLPQRTKLRR
ncbi:MAG: IS1634 family transposase [Ignavibacteriae bacterium]|nr:IS1634 family transposase [Ignavibacteriota bacterium]